MIQDEKGRDRERYQIPYGARLRRSPRTQQVENGQILVEWDPYTFSILTEESGQIRFKDIIEGLTVHEDLDEVTGLSRLIIVDSPDEKKQPTVEIKGAERQRHPPLHHAGQRPHDGAGRRRGACRRRAREDSARDDQDQGHHGRSAARGGAVRGAQAEGSGGHQRDRRHGEVRRRGQGPAADSHQRRRSATPSRRSTRFRAAST